MKTEIFKSYEHFLWRDDFKTNGVSEEFAEENPDFEKDNESNMACWNCKDCEKCIECRSCTGCKFSTDCITSVNCNRCNELVNCQDCEFLYGKSNVNNSKIETFGSLISMVRCYFKLKKSLKIKNYKIKSFGQN